MRPRLHSKITGSSYALSFTLQDAEKTLTDEQVEKAMGRIRSALEKEVGAELRG